MSIVSPMYFTHVSTAQEIAQIIALQAENLKGRYNADTERAQGFLTVRHDADVLQKMNADKPSVIAKSGDALAGYALVMPRSFADQVPVLQPMFDLLGGLMWRGALLKDNLRWFVMGQICVAEAFRGEGVFDGMYLKMKDLYRHEFDFVVTEIASRNTRSLRAHERVGFRVMHEYDDDTTGERWVVVGWDF